MSDSEDTDGSLQPLTSYCGGGEGGDKKDILVYLPRRPGALQASRTTRWVITSNQLGISFFLYIKYCPFFILTFYKIGLSFTLD